MKGGRLGKFVIYNSLCVIISANSIFLSLNSIRGGEREGGRESRMNNRLKTIIADVLSAIYESLYE